MTVDPETALRGTTIQVIPTPTTGFRLTRLTYKPEGATAPIDLLAENSNGPYSFLMPNADVTVDAEFTQNLYTLAFDLGYDGLVVTEQKTLGNTIIPPQTDNRTGYTFRGWSDIVPDTMPAKDLTFTARWEINRYTITFDTKGGSYIAPITQDYLTPVNAPDQPMKEGYTFSGWDKEIPTAMPAENQTITAQWTEKAAPVQYTITFNANGGAFADSTVYKRITQEAGTTVTIPSDWTLSRTGYTFGGWQEVPETMPEADTTVYATWTPVGYTITGTVTGDGTLTLMPANTGAAQYHYGDIVTIYATPNEYNKLTGLSFTAGTTTKDIDLNGEKP